MTFQEIWLPYTISQIVFVFLLIASWRWFRVARILWIVIFLAAGIFNWNTVTTEPQVYLMYADSAVLPFYINFIQGAFADNPQMYVVPIAIGQILISLLLMFGKPLFTLGIFGGIIFLLAIMPLGLGSAFPATLIGAISLFILGRQERPQHIFGRWYRKQT